MNLKSSNPETKDTSAATSAPVAVATPGTAPAAAPAVETSSPRELAIRKKMFGGLSRQQATECVERQERYDATRKPLPRRKI
jgi:hypothetical protein